MNNFRKFEKMRYPPFVQPARGVQIRSESDPIGFVRTSEQKY